MNIYTLLKLLSRVITFCLNIIYGNGWIFKSLLVNLINIFTIEKMTDKDVILICFRTFLSCLLLSLFDAKNANIKDIYTKKACARDAFI